MTYAVKQNLIDRFGERELIQLTDNTEIQTGAINETVLGRALEDADAEINGYLAVRHSLPLSEPPAVLERLACDIARYRLHLVSAMPEVVEKAYRDAVLFLRDVSSGKADLGITGTQSPATTSGGPRVSAADRVFSRTTLSDYR